MSITELSVKTVNGDTVDLGHFTFDGVSMLHLFSSIKFRVRECHGHTSSTKYTQTDKTWIQGNCSPEYDKYDQIDSSLDHRLLFVLISYTRGNSSLGR